VYCVTGCERGHVGQLRSSAAYVENRYGMQADVSRDARAGFQVSLRSRGNGTRAHTDEIQLPGWVLACG
jgi:hypothetical protein